VFITPLPSSKRTVLYDANPFTAYRLAIRKMSESPLLLVALASGYFCFLAGIALLILPEYSCLLAQYNVTRAEVSVIWECWGLPSDLVAAWRALCRNFRIRPILISVGAAGLTLFLPYGALFRQ